MRPVVFVLVAGACGGSSPATDGPPIDHDAAMSDALAVDAAATDAATCPSLTEVDPGVAAEVAVAGDVGSTMGIFDPSLVYPAGAPGGAMSYSSVPDQHSIRTRIAVSPDAGATWTFIAEANTPAPAVVVSSDPVECPGGTCAGAMISEVTSLVIDPDDPDPARRWKLFAHRYLVEPDDTVHYRYGTIALQTAPAPEGPWSVPAPHIGWDSPSPVSSAGVVHNVTSSPATADCLALTEPGALWRPRGAGSVIDLAVGCVYLDGATPRIRVILLRSDDHAASWSFVANVATGEDTVCVGGDPTNVNAAALFVDDGTAYIAVTPGGADGLYDGCLVFAFDDLDAGAIRRDGDGRPIITRTLASPPRFSGACAYAEGASAMGYAIPIGRFDTPRPFRIYATGVATP